MRLPLLDWALIYDGQEAKERKTGAAIPVSLDGREVETLRTLSSDGRSRSLSEDRDIKSKGRFFRFGVAAQSKTPVDLHTVFSETFEMNASGQLIYPDEPKPMAYTAPPGSADAADMTEEEALEQWGQQEVRSIEDTMAATKAAFEKRGKLLEDNVERAEKLRNAATEYRNNARETRKKMESKAKGWPF